MGIRYFFLCVATDYLASKILVAVKVGSHARRSNYKRIIQKTRKENVNEYNSGTRFLFACRASRKFCKIHDTETNTETALPRSRGHPDIVLNNDIQTNSQ